MIEKNVLHKVAYLVVGRLRAKIVHFFDKIVKIGTGVVRRMGNFSKPGSNLGCHGNRRPS